MKKNDFNSNQEFEKLLKEKMNELSSSVECFDRISARAFPESDSDFSDCGFTVSDLENVTGKRRIFPVFKWISAAAAIVLCISIIPKTALINSLRSSMDNKPDKCKFNAIISEIKKETASGDYHICDISLNDYISRDILVTPLYSCPFEECGEDLNVRLYIRTIGGIRTNQIYAVEYRGEYSEDNIVAAAESGVSFSQNETESMKENVSYYFSSEDICAETASSFFSYTDNTGLTDREGRSVSAASFTDVSFYKSGNGIAKIQTDVIYYRDNNSDQYYYDIISTDYSGREIDMPENLWSSSVCCNGVSAMPKSDSGDMSKTEIFDNPDNSQCELFFFTPECRYSWNRDKTASPVGEYIAEQHNSYEMTGEILNHIAYPEDTSFQRSMRIYLGKKVPAAVYPEGNKESAQYYNTINYTSTNGDIPSEISLDSQINDLNSELTIIDNDVDGIGVTEKDKAEMELERRKIQENIARLEQYKYVLTSAEYEQVDYVVSSGNASAQAELEKQLRILTEQEQQRIQAELEKQQRTQTEQGKTEIADE